MNSRVEVVKRLKNIKKCLKNSELSFIRKDLIYKGSIDKERRLKIYCRNGFWTGSAIEVVFKIARENARDNYWMDIDNGGIYISIQ